MFVLKFKTRRNHHCYLCQDWSWPAAGHAGEERNLHFLMSDVKVKVNGDLKGTHEGFTIRFRFSDLVLTGNAEKMLTLPDKVNF